MTGTGWFSNYGTSIRTESFDQRRHSADPNVFLVHAVRDPDGGVFPTAVGGPFAHAADVLGAGDFAAAGVAHGRVVGADTAHVPEGDAIVAVHHDKRVAFFEVGVVEQDVGAALR